MTGRRATLTFDNGPVPGVTDAVLDLLAERGVRTTFFAVGDRLADPGGRRLAERAASEGHWVGNHTMTHTVPLGRLDDAGVDGEIDGTEDRLRGIARPGRLFRPFGNGGVIDGRLAGPHALRRLHDGGFTCVLWNSVPHDWDDPDGWVERAIADVASLPDAVVVLHDIPGAAVTRLAELLDRLGELDVELTQDFPEACVPIRDGRATASYHLIAPYGDSQGYRAVSAPA